MELTKLIDLFYCKYKEKSPKTTIVIIIIIITKIKITTFKFNNKKYLNNCFDQKARSKAGFSIAFIDQKF